MGAVRATKAEMARALDAWIARGLPVGALDVLPDGTIRISAPVDSPQDRAQDRRKPVPW